MAEPAALIVGGGGYFGARLAEDLSATHDVTITYRSISKQRQAWIDRTGVRAIHFDSAAGTELPDDVAFDLVVNLAMAGANEAKSDPQGAVERGLATARVCAVLLDDKRAERLIHFSTFHVYGEAGAPSYPEDTAPAPKHPYGDAHLAVERFLELYSGALILRPTNMVGAPAHDDIGDQAGLIFLDLCRQAAQNRKLGLRNDGASYRDILAFPDAIRAVRLLSKVRVPETRVFNLAAGHAITLAEIAEGIAAETPGEVPIAYGDGTDAFRSSFNVDIRRLQELGWTPEWNFRDEVRRAVDAFR